MLLKCILPTIISLSMTCSAWANCSDHRESNHSKRNCCEVEEETSCNNNRSHHKRHNHKKRHHKKSHCPSEHRCHTKRTDKTLNNPSYRRVITLSQDKVWPGAVTPIDPDQSIALGLTYKNGNHFYSQAQVDAITAEAYQQLYLHYGVDARSVIPLPGGIRIVPGVGTGIPTIIGADKSFFLVEDTKHPERGVSDRWYDVEVGIIFAFTDTYTVPLGFLNEGAIALPGYLFSFGQINLVKNDSNEREIINFSTTNFLATVADSENGNRSYVICNALFDEKGNQGLYLSATAVLKDPDNSPAGFTYYVQERPALTWNCPNQIIAE